MQKESDQKSNSRLYETKFSFGTTSAIITTLALITGLDNWAHAKAGIISGILVMALADNISDSVGIHVFQESEDLSPKEVWLSTISNFVSRLLVSLSFIIPVVLLPIHTAVIVSVAWGLLLLSFLSYLIAKDRKVNPLSAIFEHLSIAIVVVVLSSIVGSWITNRF